MAYSMIHLSRRGRAFGGGAYSPLTRLFTVMIMPKRSSAWGSGVAVEAESAGCCSGVVGSWGSDEVEVVGVGSDGVWSVVSWVLVTSSERMDSNLWRRRASEDTSSSSRTSA